MGKKGVAIVIASKLGKPSEKKDEGNDHDEALEDAASSIISAVKNGNAAGLKDALKSFYELCQHGPKEDEY